MRWTFPVLQGALTRTLTLSLFHPMTVKTGAIYGGAPTKGWGCLATFACLLHNPQDEAAPWNSGHLPFCTAVLVALQNLALLQVDGEQPLQGAVLSPSAL